MTSGSGTRQCVSCGRTIAWDANVCQHCGHDYRAGAQQMVAPKKHSVMPIIGGILIIIGGILELIWGVILISGGAAFEDLTMGLSGSLVVCGVVLAIFGVIAFLGGVFSFMRKHFGLAVVGGILALPGFFVPALIGLILIAISRDEYE